MEDTLEVSNQPPKKSSETPWGQSWADLLRSLRPSTHDESRMNAVIATVRSALDIAQITPSRLECGGPFGCGTHARDYLTLQLYAVYSNDKFHPDNYLDAHLQPLQSAIKSLDPQPQSILSRGLAVTFIIDDIPVALYAAGELPAGPAQLVYQSPQAILPEIRIESTNISSSSSTTTNLNNNNLVSNDNQNFVNSSMNSNGDTNSVSSTITDSITSSNPGGSINNSQTERTTARGVGVGAGTGGGGVGMDPRSVHVDTTCAVLRASVLRTQPMLYKDMVRVGRKWLNDQNLDPVNRPNDYLLHLLMLAAVRSTPLKFRSSSSSSEKQNEWTGDVSPDTYRDILRRMLHLASATEIHQGDTIYTDASPSSASPLFLWWPLLYDRPVIEHCIATSQLMTGDRASGCVLLVVDIAAPFVNVARTLKNWFPFRDAARRATLSFERRSTIQTLQGRLQTLSQGFEESVLSLRKQLASLQHIENAPRRWTGSIQFTEQHILSDKWISVLEVKLRTFTWRVNVRKARTEGIGYSNMVDLSLQFMEDAREVLARPLDVDVVFRSNTISLSFDKDNDHVFLQKRSEIVRNRDYPLQITIVA